MEVLHAIFHRRLVGTRLGKTAAQQRPPPAIHALGDVVVLDRGLHVRGLLGLDEFTLEGDDLLGVVKLDNVQRAINVVSYSS